MLIGTVQVVGTLATTLVIDKFGRKIILIISELFMGISMIGVAVFFLLFEKCGDECETSASLVSTTVATSVNISTTILPDVLVSKTTVDSVGFLPLLSLMVFVAAFSFGAGPIPWILNVELIPPEARVSRDSYLLISYNCCFITYLFQALSASLATSFNWLVSFLVSQFIPDIGDAIGASSCYFIFSAICLMGTVFTILFVPETKGKSEDEIKNLFSTKGSTTLNSK